MEANEKQAKSSISPAPLLPSCRLMLTLMTCSSLIVLGLLRSNLTISLICMVKRPPPPPLLNLTLDANDSDRNSNATGRWPNTQGEFVWSRQYQGFLLSAYFYGYLAVQLIGGLLAGRLGAKHVLGTSVLMGAVLTLLTPAVARFNPHLLIFLRSLIGAATGFIYPSIQALLGIWAPPLERSILSALTFSGLNIGYMLAFLISSQFCQVSMDNGWPFAFYATGGISLLFWIFWNSFVFSSPEQHPRISERELSYIKSATGSKTQDLNQRKPFPWRKALLSPAVIALLVVQTSQTWFSYTQVTSASLYLKDVLRFDVKQNGLFMILPYLLVLFATTPLGFLADLIRRKKILSTTAVRKLFQTICSFGSAVLISVLGFIDYERRYAAVAVIMIMHVVSNVGRFGFLVNPQDIAPRYSGEIFGIANTVATLSGIFAPIVVGQLTLNGTLNEWRMVFLISAAVFCVGGLVFLIFAKGEPLSWAKEDSIEMNQVAPENKEEAKIPGKEPFQQDPLETDEKKR